MPFCCIAIVGIAIIYFIVLWMRQLFTWPRPDKNHPSRLRPPPRALSGNRALPVYGHTHLFLRRAGNIALEFPPHWTEVSFLPRRTRQLGECFAIFIWGQWRVAIKGPTNAAKFFEGQTLKQSWPWSPPVRLLGNSCLPILQEHDPEQAEELKSLIAAPLSHSMVLQFAPQFARCAEKCLNEIQEQQQRQNSYAGGSNEQSGRGPPSRVAVPSGGAASYEYESSNAGPESSRFLDYKVKWEALRSYTLDIMDGPLWSMNLYNTNNPPSTTPTQVTSQEDPASTITPTQAHGQSTKEEGGPSCPPLPPKKQVYGTQNQQPLPQQQKETRIEKRDRPPDRELMLLWIERMKLGIDVIKTTFGPEWMYIWIFNEYGRAINARMYVERVLSKHIKKMEETVPVARKRGHASYDPSTRLIPLLAVRDNLARDHEDIFGERILRSGHRTDHETDRRARPRSYSQPCAWQEESMTGVGTLLEDVDAAMTSDYITPYETEQDLARPRYENSPVRSTALATKIGAHPNAILQLQPPMQATESPSLRKMRKEIESVTRDVAVPEETSNCAVDKSHYTPSNSMFKSPPPRKPLVPLSSHDTKPQTEKPVMPLLERLLRQKGPSNKGISQTVLTELNILLWMMMDVGNAWTAMALHLLSTDRDACFLVHEELDDLEEIHGSNLYSPSVLKKMKYLDALLFESIRLLPPFLGGLKTTTETVELPDANVQVAKGSDVFFCQPTDMKFDLQKAMGQRPETLGKRYPCVELYGFLPLQGLEVPLMVLQSKVFLIVALQDFSPHTCRRKTFVRRVKHAVGDLRSSLKGFTPIKEKVSAGSDLNDSVVDSAAVERNGGSLSSFDVEVCLQSPSGEISQTEAMRLFTKIPFPEPKNVIRLRPRIFD